MSKTQQDAAIVQCVADFTQDLTVLIRQAALEAVETTFAAVPRRRAQPSSRLSSAKPSAASPARSRGPKKQAGAQSPARVEELGTQVLAYLKSNPKQTVGELADAIGLGTEELKRPIGLLLETGWVTKEGQKRGTRYSAA